MTMKMPPAPQNETIPRQSIRKEEDPWTMPLKLVCSNSLGALET